MSLLTKLRLRSGLLWKGQRPSLADIDRIADGLITALVVLAFLLLLGWLDARDAEIAAEIKAEQSSASFARFLNGAAIVDQAGHFAARCEHLIEVTQ